MTSVYKRVDRILPGETDQIEVDGVINKDGKVDDRFIDVEKHPDPAFRGTEVDQLSQAYDRFWSAGVISGADISYDSGTQTITVAPGQALLRSAATETSPLESISFPSVSFSVGPTGDINFDDPSYISLDYNSGPGGTPIPVIAGSSSSINCQDNCLMYTLIVDSQANELFVLDGKAQNVDHNAKLRRRFFNTERLARASNGTLVSAVPGSLYWQLSAGTFYFSLSAIDHDAFDTSGTDTYTLYYENGGPTGFTRITGQKELNNTQWNNGGTLTTLNPANGSTGNAYNITWLYVILSSNGVSEIAGILGQDEYYTVAEAQAETPPTNLPTLIQAVGVLVGRAIVGGDFVGPPTEPALVETTFARVFTPTSADQHNNLGGLQGGTTDLYEHSDQGINQADSPNWAHVRAQYSPTSTTATGNAGNVGFGFAGDEDTGMFQNGPNTLEFATAGTSRLRLLSDGDAILTGTGQLTLHRGPTGGRPGSPVNGMIRYNTTDEAVEFYVDGNWQQLGGSSGTGDFVHRYGDTMTGNLNVNAATTGSTLSTGGNATFTNDTAFIDLVPTGAGAKARMALDSANQQMEFFVLNSAGGTFTVPGLVIDNSISTQDVRPGTDESARLGTVSNKWANVISAEFMANNGTAANPAYSFIGAQDTGIFHDGALNLTVDADNKLSLDTDGVTRLLDTSAIRVNNGTVAQRPTGENGMIRYDTDNNVMEFYINGSWVQLGATGGSGDFVNRNGDTMLGSLNMNSNFLLSPADPTTGAHVGDRNYNDARYVNETGDTMTGDLSMSASNVLTDTGTATTPTYTFNGDTDTGMYSPGADQVYLTTGGADAVQVDTSGVTITNDLLVQGTADLPNVGTFNLLDPIIRVNEQETGAGVTSGTGVSGIEVERGTLANTQWVFDETNDWWGPNNTFRRLGNINYIDVTTAGAAGQSLEINGNGAIAVPNGVTTQRPGVPGGTTAQNGMIRYNDTDNVIEFYVNGSWVQIGSGGGSGDFVNRNGDTMTGDLDMGGNILLNPADPTAGTHVGDRDYNDNRYVFKAGDTMTGDLIIDTTGALTIPDGTSAQRPASPDQGMIRYNTSFSGFEGYDGTNWRGLGGVIDVDQDTYIQAETSAGADNDELEFFAAGSKSLGITSTATTFTSTADINGNVLQNPVDPTAGTHVGDRDYNDNRYLRSDVADTAAGNIEFNNGIRLNAAATTPRVTPSPLNIEIAGPDGSWTRAIQDGNGRVHSYWNVDPGTQELQEDNEGASWVFQDGGNFEVSLYDGVVGDAGTVPPWTKVIDADTSGVSLVNPSTGGQALATELYVDNKFPIGSLGQTLFIRPNNTNTVENDYLLEAGLFTNNSEELNDALNTTISLASVFNDWYRFSHDNTNTYPADASELSSWSYDAVTDTISSTINSATYLGFVSEQFYEDYEHFVEVDSPGGDNDLIGVVIAYVEEGVRGQPGFREHTLSAYRTYQTTGSGAVGGGNWQVVYNYNQSDQKTITDNSSTALVSSGTGWADTTGTAIEIKRTGDIVEARCSQFDSTTIDNSTLITVDLSTDPDLDKFRGPVRYGYSAHSQDGASFSNITFVGGSDFIFDLATGDVYTYDSGTSSWTIDSTKTFEDEIGYGRLLHNPDNGKTWFRDNVDTYLISELPTRNNVLRTFTLAAGAQQDYDVTTLFADPTLVADRINAQVTVLDNTAGPTNGFYINSEAIATVGKNSTTIRVVNEDTVSHDFKILMTR